MYLKELIEFLSKQEGSKILPYGFAYPHSYRGDYSQIAFEPARNVTIASMLECAKSAHGKTFEGYKGGSYRMDDYTDCYLAHYSECGEPLSEVTLQAMMDREELERLREENAKLLLRLCKVLEEKDA